MSLRVETQADFFAALEQGGFDLILADYTLPSFDGLSALKIALEKCPDVPFIFVSGTLGEEVAIEALKIGATDYVLKERLSRIVPSVHRALREAQERTERKLAEEALWRSEAYLAEAQRLSHTGSWAFNVATRQIVHWSHEHFRIFGFDPQRGYRHSKQCASGCIRTIKPGPPHFLREPSVRERTTNWSAASCFPTVRCDISTP